MNQQDNYLDVARQFSEYLADFCNPDPHHTTFHFGYKPMMDMIESDGGFLNKNILDYGCGSGQFAAFLSANGSVVTGIDASMTMLETARKNFPGLANSFIHVSDEDKLMQNFYDICTMNFIISEIKEEKELTNLFQKIFNHLKPGGKLLILTNNPERQPNGAKFVSWSVEKVDITKAGESFKITIHDKETSFDLQDYFWPRDLIIRKLEQIGFQCNGLYEPILREDMVQTGWKDESNIPPTLIYVAIKS